MIQLGQAGFLQRDVGFLQRSVVSSSTQWKVFSSGNVRPGYAVDAVCAALQKLFNIDAELAIKLVQGRRVLVRKGLPEARARQFLEALTGIGLDAHIVEHTLPDQTGLAGVAIVDKLQDVASAGHQAPLPNAAYMQEPEQVQCPACLLRQGLALVCAGCGTNLEEPEAGPCPDAGLSATATATATAALAPQPVAEKSASFPFRRVAAVLVLLVLVCRFFYGDSSNYIAVGSTAEARVQMAAMEAARKQQFISPAELQTLLAAGHFRKVDKLLAELDARFRKDILWERAYSDVIEGFSLENSYRKPIFDRWVSSTGSAYAYLARGTLLASMGWAAREGNMAQPTSSARLREMDRLFALARADLEKARSMDAGLLPVYGQLISLSKAVNQIDADVLLQQAIAVNPAAYGYRDHYLWALTPRWGGSYEEMQRFIDATRPYNQLNPALYQLGGYIDSDKAVAAMTANNFSACILHYSQALKYGISARWLRNRAWCLMHDEDYELALQDVDRSLALQDNEDARKIKAYVEYRLR